MTRFTPRGAPADYDGWAALGNAGWGFDDVLPYFIRLESDKDFGDRPWHGDRGPMPSTRYLDLDYTDVAAASLDALVAAGFPAIEDHNRPGAVGAGRMPMGSRDGIRVTTADAYVPLGATPPNLAIQTDSQVADVVFDGVRASGVRLVDGTVIEAGWVVLCAGTYGSPAILMRSGIGPVEHLRSVGVSVPRRSGGRRREPRRPSRRGRRLRVPRSGAERSDPPSDRHLPQLVSTSDGPPDLMLWVSDPAGQPASFEIGVVLLKPRSRGIVRLRSTDPAEPPVIELPDLSDPTDIERLVEGYRRAYELARRPEIRRLCAGPLPAEPGRKPGCGISSARSATPYPTSSAPARWARGPTTGRWSMRQDASMAPRRSASPTPRSCPTCRQGSPTSRRS